MHIVNGTTWWLQIYRIVRNTHPINSETFVVCFSCLEFLIGTLLLEVFIKHWTRWQYWSIVPVQYCRHDPSHVSADLGKVIFDNSLDSTLAYCCTLTLFHTYLSLGVFARFFLHSTTKIYVTCDWNNIIRCIKIININDSWLLTANDSRWYLKMINMTIVTIVISMICITIINIINHWIKP